VDLFFCSGKEAFVRDPLDYIQLAAKAGMAIFILYLLYHLWVYIVFFLALTGAYYIWQEYERNNNDRNRWR